MEKTPEVSLGASDVKTERERDDYDKELSLRKDERNKRRSFWRKITGEGKASEIDIAHDEALAWNEKIDEIIEQCPGITTQQAKEKIQDLEASRASETIEQQEEWRSAVFSKVPTILKSGSLDKFGQLKELLAAYAEDSFVGRIVLGDEGVKSLRDQITDAVLGEGVLATGEILGFFQKGLGDFIDKERINMEKIKGTLLDLVMDLTKDEVNKRLKNLAVAKLLHGKDAFLEEVRQDEEFEISRFGAVRKISTNQILYDISKKWVDLGLISWEEIEESSEIKDFLQKYSDIAFNRYDRFSGSR